MVFFIFLSFLYSLVCTLHATLHFNNSKSQSGKRELFSTTGILINTKKTLGCIARFHCHATKN